MIVVATGSRTWTDEAAIKLQLQVLYTECGLHDEKLTVVVGYNEEKDTPRGVDRMVYKWCKALGIDVIPEPADWSKGKGAGFMRNALMLDKYKPDKVIAFRAEGKSNGTDHCIKEAKKRGIEVEVHHERGRG